MCCWPAKPTTLLLGRATSPASPAAESLGSKPIEEGPDFLIGKILTTDSIAAGGGDTRYYSWVGSDDLGSFFSFVRLTVAPCIDDAP